MTLPNLTEETSEEIISWMRSIRASIPEWYEPNTADFKGIRPPLFDPSTLLKRGFLAVPFIEHWAPSLDNMFDLSKMGRKERIYAGGLISPTEPVYSSPIEGKDIEKIIGKHICHCILLPRDESFMVINTFLDYWILAGPPTLVEAACGGSIPMAFERFAQEVATLDDWFEAGPPFSKHIILTYKKHNEEILAKINCKKEGNKTKAQ